MQDNGSWASHMGMGFGTRLVIEVGHTTDNGITVDVMGSVVASLMDAESGMMVIGKMVCRMGWAKVGASRN
jgi:hypothetical protein